MQSSIAVEKRDQLRREVDQIKFTHSPFITTVEKELKKFNESSSSSLLKVEQESEDIIVTTTEREEADQFLDLLEEKYHLKSKKKEMKFMKHSGVKRSLLKKIFLSKLFKIKKLSPSIIEMSLFKVFVRLKNSLQKP